MKKSLLLLRRVQLSLSVAIFGAVFLICYKTTGFHITDIPLSRWGITQKVGWLWNSCLVLLGASCYFNIYHYLQSHPHLQFKRYFTLAFFFQCINICLLGIFVSGYLIHGIVAYTYFFTLPFTIYLLAALNRKRVKFSEWVFHTVLSVCMITIPLIALLSFKGKAIAESTHSLAFIIWNAYLLKENFE